MQAVLENLYPKRLISEIELLFGPSIIYPRGDKFTKKNRVPKLGVCATLGFTHQFSPRFGINLKAIYESKGLKAIYYSFNADYNPPATQKGVMDITLNYATISLLPRYFLGRKLKLYTGVGPYLSYLLTEKYYAELYINASLITKSGSRPDPDLYYKKIDAGLTSIVGYNSQINAKRDFSIQFAWNLGLMNVNNPALYPILSNNSFSLLLGVSLHKKGTGSSE